MNELLVEKLIQSVKEVESHYYRLVLLVGKIGSGKTEVLNAYANNIGIEVLNVNLMLSKELLELTQRQRILKIPEILKRLSNTSQKISILDNLELLFDKNLKMDPIRLLKDISRDRTIITSWNGSITNDKLIYAKLGHPEYQVCDAHDIFFVTMDGMATIDIDKTFNR